jgi:hypothetical protein
VNARNETALSLACAQKEIGVVRLLCQKMTNLDPGINKHVPDVTGPVHYICKAKNVEIAKIVLERAQSFDVNRLDEQGRPGPCHLIDGTNPKDAIEILDALVQAGFDVNLHCRDTETIIQKFIRGIAPNLNAPIVKWLMAHGADLRVRFRDGKRAIDVIRESKVFSKVCRDEIERWEAQNASRARK